METKYKILLPQPTGTPFSHLIINIYAQTYVEQNYFILYYLLNIYECTNLIYY